MEPAMRFELMTSSLPRRRSTPELRGHVGQVANLPVRWSKTHLNKLSTCPAELGAGDEIRTRDPQLGRLMLYQLSYTRSLRRNFKSQTCNLKFHLVQGVGFEPT